ncbi:MAG: hypothetical protein ACXAE3_02460 [Candidatus Kariarchaeaceae archaeon]|jgi:hypothetical protein
MDLDERESRLQKIIESITRAALADGKITPEEKGILESVQINVLIYDQALEDALEDGIIDKTEQDTLHALKHAVLNDAYEIAEVSEGVSKDELKLLQVLLAEIESED